MSNGTVAPREAVIRRPVAADLDRQRVARLQVIAFVVSGAVHVALIAALIAIDTVAAKPAAAAPAEAQLTVVTDDTPPPPPAADLTNVDIGLDPSLVKVAPNDSVADVNVDAGLVTKDDPGMKDAAVAPPTEFVPPPGASTGDMAPGAIGADGPLLSGAGVGGTGVTASPGFSGRSAATRSALLKAGGGNAETEARVARGMAWLSKQQKPDGRWQFDDSRDPFGKSKLDVVAATGMALLPFLAAGQTHRPAPDNKYQANVQKGLDFLVGLQKANGSFVQPMRNDEGKVAPTPAGMYSHAIATIALCEALGMTGDRRLTLPAQRAVNYILTGQGSDGAWYYTHGKPGGDTSIVGWQLQALHSAKLCRELVVDKRVIARAMRFLDSVAAGPQKAQFGYKEPQTGRDSLTAVGLLCKYYEGGWGPQSPGLAAGVKYLLERRPPGPGREMDLYYYYYATQVVHFYEQQEWHRDWNPAMQRMLMDRQVPQADPKNGGSWDPAGDPWIGIHCGRVGMTAMALLTLEVYYRHLPLYKRGTGGLGVLEQVR
ncbi:MAG: prenyltransferase/squalene oxidase repeat-containing protein [Gemmataceae bacterium]